MSVKQISIFVENRTGHLSEVTSLLAKNDINLRALSIADTSDFGILRVIVKDVEACEKILKDNGFTATTTNVLAVAMDDKSGSLASILDVLSKAEVSIEYAYAFLLHKVDTACLILRVDDNEKAEAALSEAGIHLATAEELF